MMMDFDSFASLKDALDKLPDQVTGLPASVSDVGEEYVQFFESALSRPDDVAVIERAVANRMWRSMNDYLSRREGRIYWRIPFETDIDDHAVVLRYDDNGPDMDFLTNRKCYTDKSWKRVACYARLYRATLAIPQKPPQQIRAELRVPIDYLSLQSVK